MGGPIDRHGGRWTAAIDGGADIEVVTCAAYAARPDWRIDGRVIDQHICNLAIDGAIVLTVGSRRRMLAAGSAWWINPGVPHSLHLADPARPFHMLNLRFRVHCGRRQLGFPADALMVDDAWDLRPLWDLLIDDRQQQRPDRASRFRHVLALLHGDLSRRDADGGVAGGLSRSRRQDLVAWLAAHLHQRPTPADLAAVVGLSPDWFRRAFTRTFGCSPRAWIVRERIRRAAQRLADEPEVGIAELAGELGYDDHRLFDRQFRAVLRVSPSVWRRR